jgi:hypothetical protein
MSISAIKTEYMIIRNSDYGITINPRKPVGIIALRSDGEHVYIGTSFVAPQDNFNTKLGVIKATGRTNSKDAPVVPLSESFNEIMDQKLHVIGLGGSSRAKSFAEVFKKKVVDPR